MKSPHLLRVSVNLLSELQRRHAVAQSNRVVLLLLLLLLLLVLVLLIVCGSCRDSLQRLQLRHKACWRQPEARDVNVNGSGSTRVL
jgi:hypothetical protein